MSSQHSRPVPFRVCILGYSKAAALAREVVNELPKSDVEYLILEAGLAEQDACVAEARQLGCEVFIAGPAGAARFTSRYGYPVVPFQVSDIDYLRAIRTALDRGYEHIGIVRYRYDTAVNLSLYQKLMNTTITELVFTDISQVYEIVAQTHCDLLIGPVVVQEAAAAAGKASLLIYAGKEAIRNACLRAGELIKKLYEANRNRLVAESVLNTTQLGIIITNTDHTIEFFNRTMQNYTSLSPHQVIGQPLEEVFPNLPLHQFIKSNINQNEGYHIINTTMMRCIFRRLTVNSCYSGTLMTFHPNPHNRKKDRQAPVYSIAPVYQLDKVTAYSSVMKRLVNLCRQLSPVEYHTAMIGTEGSGREELAHCLHNASRRASKPCITIDCASIPDNRAAEILYGHHSPQNASNGLLLNAIGGSVVLKNLGLASPRTLSILKDALLAKQIYYPGMTEPVTLDIIFYTIAQDEEYRHLRADMRRALSILQIRVPSLKERPEDIGVLFVNYVNQQLPHSRSHVITQQMQAVLTTYSWPGNLIELRAVSTRYAVLYKMASSRTPLYRYRMLLDAIGTDELKDDIYKSYPALEERPVQDTENFRAGVQALRNIFHDTYEEIGNKLNISRTTLWRIMHKK